MQKNEYCPICNYLSGTYSVFMCRECGRTGIHHNCGMYFKFLYGYRICLDCAEKLGLSCSICGTRNETIKRCSDCGKVVCKSCLSRSKDFEKRYIDLCKNCQPDVAKEYRGVLVSGQKAEEESVREMFHVVVSGFTGSLLGLVFGLFLGWMFGNILGGAIVGIIIGCMLSAVTWSGFHLHPQTWPTAGIPILGILIGLVMGGGLYGVGGSFGGAIFGCIALGVGGWLASALLHVGDREIKEEIAGAIVFGITGIIIGGALVLLFVLIYSFFGEVQNGSDGAMFGAVLGGISCGIIGSMAGTEYGWIGRFLGILVGMIVGSLVGMVIGYMSGGSYIGMTVLFGIVAGIIGALGGAGESPDTVLVNRTAKIIPAMLMGALLGAMIGGGVAGIGDDTNAWEEDKVVIIGIIIGGLIMATATALMSHNDRHKKIE